MNGNITMKEYFRDPEATRKAFEGGYFHSGDLAVVHPDGYVAVQDRSTDIIISGGEVCVVLYMHMLFGGVGLVLSGFGLFV